MTGIQNSDISGKEEKKEDYALEKVPQHYRLNWWGLTNVAIGVGTALVFMQMGSLMAVTFGAVNALLAAIYATIVSGGLGIVIAYLSAKSGMNVNLMARGGGFGYIGASLTSLIFAINFIMYCALEGAIMAGAVHEYLPMIPLWANIIFFGLVVIPFNWFGVKQLEKLQKWSLLIFTLLLSAGLIVAANMTPAYSGFIWTFLPGGTQVGGTALLTCIGINNGLVGIFVLLTSDYARFIKHEQLKIGVFAVGFIPSFIGFFVIELIGIWFGVRFMEINPGIYFVGAIGVFGALFSIITQFRINITNLYSGSLALSNFFQNMFNFKPSRTFWVITVAVVAIISMLAGALNYIGPLLTFQGVFLFSWVAIIIADATVIKKGLKLGPNYFEHQKENLYAWNPVGTISLIVASVVGTFAAFGSMGTFLQNTSAFLAGIIAFVLAILLAIGTKGKYYVKINTYEEQNLRLKEAETQI
jgi:purine-cytosine permease-like protein